MSRINNKQKVLKKDSNENNTNYISGQLVELKDAKLYTRFCSNIFEKKISGKYYIWEPSIKNNRIRITSNKNMVNVPGQITGWIDIFDIC